MAKNVLRYLALGDSYTIGEGVPDEQNFPTQLVRKMNELGYYFGSPEVIAKTGWRTDNLLKAVEKQKAGNDFDLVSLLIGVNNQYRKRPVEIYKEEFDLLLETAIKHTAGNDPQKVLVLSIPDYGYTPFGAPLQEQISKELDEYNFINKKISEAYGVWYFDITDISRQMSNDKNLIAEDNLHPSAKQYKLWVDRILENREFVKALKSF